MDDGEPTRRAPDAADPTEQRALHVKQAWRGLRRNLVFDLCFLASFAASIWLFFRMCWPAVFPAWILLGFLYLVFKPPRIDRMS